MDGPEAMGCSRNEAPQDENESGLKKHYEQIQLTEDEETFQGPKFYPPVYRRRYAAVCELANKHHSKKVIIPKNNNVAMFRFSSNFRSHKLLHRLEWGMDYPFLSF